VSDTWIDGNVLAGPLGELVSFEVTTALARCDECARVSVLAETHVYADGPGFVVRCPGCDIVLLRLVQDTAGGRSWLDLRGISYLQVRLDT
jgi:hypothetical protein